MSRSNRDPIKSLIVNLGQILIVHFNPFYFANFTSDFYSNLYIVTVVLWTYYQLLDQRSLSMVHICSDSCTFSILSMYGISFFHVLQKLELSSISILLLGV